MSGINLVLNDIAKFMPEINNALGAGIFVFARMAAFLRFSPVFERKEIPGFIKLCFALIMTIILVSVLKPTAVPVGTSLVYGVVINFAFGAMLAFIANCILHVVGAAGDMINMQMGMSSAMVLDPTSGSQVSVMGRVFSLLGLIIFIHVGGFYWMFSAFVRSFEVFPMYGTAIPLEQVINLPYLVLITSNILYVGLQIASPVLLATLGQDIILGIISKTAPQINVFQLSFLFKPVLGSLILIWVMPIFINIINDYFISFSAIF